MNKKILAGLLILLVTAALIQNNFQEDMNTVLIKTKQH
jgi:hypothetical protein